MRDVKSEGENFPVTGRTKKREQKFINILKDSVPEMWNSCDSGQAVLNYSYLGKLVAGRKEDFPSPKWQGKRLNDGKGFQCSD